MNRSLISLTLTALTSVAAFAQSPIAQLTADAKADWNEIKGTLVKAAEKMPEADYAFKPTPTVRSYGEEVAHAADVQTMICSLVTGSGALQQKGKTKKADLIAYLQASNAECDKAFAMITDATATNMVKLPWMSHTKLGVLQYNTGHSNETYGTMVVYLRLKGQVPPTSQK